MKRETFNTLIESTDTRVELILLKHALNQYIYIHTHIHIIFVCVYV
jgi:hypothetical protein